MKRPILLGAALAVAALAVVAGLGSGDSSPRMDEKKNSVTLDNTCTGTEEACSSTGG